MTYTRPLTEEERAKQAQIAEDAWNEQRKLSARLGGATLLERDALLAEIKRLVAVRIKAENAALGW